MTKPHNQPATVAIIYGFCEGPRVARRFQKQLATAGFQIVKDAAQADIIIGHSGGCLIVPLQNRARHIILIGPTYWPGRSVPTALYKKFIIDLHSHHREGDLRFWLRKTFWNVFYFWRMPANIRMLRALKHTDMWQLGGRVTVIRNELDTTCIPNVESMPFMCKPHFVRLPGHHDDCWRKPKDYIAVVQS